MVVTAASGGTALVGVDETALDTQNSIRVPSDVSAGGKEVAFFNIGERQEDLFIGSPDGPMRRVTDDPARNRAPMFTPDGRSLVFYSNRDGNWAAWIIGIDGARLAGSLRSDNGRPSGVGVYEIGAQTTTMISADETPAVRWLADSRRVVYFTKNGWELVVLDTVTRKRTIVDVRLPGPSTNEIFAISPDNRTIYYGAARAEADIWIMERN
jgi:dipeptidyl aminopeptidase/acylaminoacyl peptidase